jgi:hypothetical protein
MSTLDRPESRRIFIPPGPLIGNLLWAAIAFVALRCHFYDFMSAVALFKVLNELRMSRPGPRSLAEPASEHVAVTGSHLPVK